MSWNSPAERPPYVCGGKADRGVPLSEVRWKVQTGRGGWVPRDGSQRARRGLSCWAGGAGRPALHPRLRDKPHGGTPSGVHFTCPVPRDSIGHPPPTPFQKS